MKSEKFDKKYIENAIVEDEEVKEDLAKVIDYKKLLEDAIGSRLSDEVKEEIFYKIIDTLGIEIKDKYGESVLPRIYVNNNPQKFNAYTRIKTYECKHSWAGTDTLDQQVVTLIGDLDPGVDEEYEYSDNGNITDNEKRNTVSDFSMDKLQVAIVAKEEDVDIINSYYDKSISIEIYIPEEREYNIVSYKDNFIQERTQALRNRIKEMCKGKVTDEDINKILSNVDIISEEDEIIDIPEITVTSNSDEFCKDINEIDYETEHSWAGTDSEQRHTTAILGDLEPGTRYQYEYSDNGNITDNEERNTVSDFSMNKVQAAITEYEVENNIMNYYSNKNKSIKIYIPEEREYDIVSYKDNFIQERTQALRNRIKEMCKDKITDEDINKILSNVDIISEGNEIIDIPEITVTSNPDEFCKDINEIDYVVEHSWAGTDSEQRHTTVILGDLEPGTRYQYEYSDNGNITDNEERSTVSDFTMNKIQAAITEYEIDNNIINSYRVRKINMRIYIPEEREYDIVSYKEKFEKIKEKTEREIIIEEIKDKQKEIKEIQKNNSSKEVEEQAKDGEVHGI